MECLSRTQTKAHTDGSTDKDGQGRTDGRTAKDPSQPATSKRPQPPGAAAEGTAAEEDAAEKAAAVEADEAAAEKAAIKDHWSLVSAKAMEIAAHPKANVDETVRAGEVAENGDSNTGVRNTGLPHGLDDSACVRPPSVEHDRRHDSKKDIRHMRKTKSSSLSWRVEVGAELSFDCTKSY